MTKFSKNNNKNCAEIVFAINQIMGYYSDKELHFHKAGGLAGWLMVKLTAAEAEIS